MSYVKYFLLLSVVWFSLITQSACIEKEKIVLSEWENEQETDQAPSKELKKTLCIVVDPGHGGVDPGKVNVDGVAEKEINLQIAVLLKRELEKCNISVVMTRETDNGLYAGHSKAKKSEDMRKRCERIEDADPVCTVSVHQNSFPDASVCGPQVFYYHSSEEGRNLAEILQSVLNENLQIAKPREAKSNSDYYILKRSSSTTVLVECGFLSNEKEACLLTTKQYQQKVARSICQGLLTWLNGNCYNEVYEYENIQD